MWQLKWRLCIQLKGTFSQCQMCISCRWCQSYFMFIYFVMVNSAFNGSVHSIKQNADQWITSKKECGRSGLGLIWGTSLAFCSKDWEMPWKHSHHSLSTSWIFNMGFKKWCHWGANCLNVLFIDVTGGCWLFECAVHWCHWGAACLTVMLNDVTAGSDDHISLGVMTVHVTLRFFPKTTSQISSLMWCVCVCVCVYDHL
jgi:hypothetical protein